jgi:hypothetical protein
VEIGILLVPLQQIFTRRNLPQREELGALPHFENHSAFTVNKMRLEGEFLTQSKHKGFEHHFVLPYGNRHLVSCEATFEFDEWNVPVGVNGPGALDRAKYASEAWHIGPKRRQPLAESLYSRSAEP